MMATGICFNEAAGNTPRENEDIVEPKPQACRRFNEAAGNTPRKTPRSRQGRLPGRTDCFNEAAGNTPRKTSPASARTATGSRCFNEAAGNTPRKTP